MKSKLLTFLAGAAICGTQSAPAGDDSQSSGPQRLVLVHGFLENGSAWHWMRKRLEAHGHTCLVPRLSPSDGRGGLDTLAAGLKRDIDAQYGDHQPISIIAFSMGGLVSRYYLQELGGAKRCRHLFTIASPHQGTNAAWLYPGKGAEQMRPGSGFLRALGETESRLGSMHVVSYRTPLDLIIVPSTNSVWDRADNVSHPALMHPLMVTSRKVLDDIVRRLEE